jgi:cyclase
MKQKRRLIGGALVSVLVIATAFVPVIANADDHQVVTDTHRFTKIGEGVYLAQSTAPLFNSNALVLVNDVDVIVVDSHITPQKGRELIASIRKITQKPITKLINSHFHYDHTHGNQVFGPHVEIIGHEFTRLIMAGAPLQEGTFLRGKKGTSAYLAKLEADLQAATDETVRAQLQSQRDLQAKHVQSWAEVQPVAPNVTFKNRMVIYRGDREIQLLFLGRAHTTGDISVYLPNEGVIFTGDMMLAGPSWLGNGYVDEWDETLENLKQLKFDVIVPGHGDAFTDRDRIDLVQGFYRDLWAKVETLNVAGVSVENAAKTLDMTDYKDTFGISQVGFDPLAVARMYVRMEEKQ